MVVSEGAEGGEGGAARERGVLLDDFFRFRPGDEVIIQFSAFCAEGKIVGGLFPEIETAAVGVVKEEAIGNALAKSHEKRNRFVKRVGGFPPAERIAVPPV